MWMWATRSSRDQPGMYVGVAEQKRWQLRLRLVLGGKDCHWRPDWRWVVSGQKDRTVSGPRRTRPGGWKVLQVNEEGSSRPTSCRSQMPIKGGGREAAV